MSLYAAPTLTLRNVLNAIREVTEWRLLGDQLNINAAKIRQIEIDNRGQVADCRRELIQYWLQSDQSCSWERLVDALRTIGIREYEVLTEQIRTTYCPWYQGQLAWPNIRT